LHLPGFQVPVRGFQAVAASSRLQGDARADRAASVTFPSVVDERPVDFRERRLASAPKRL
jgi:hypothetical protein